MTSTAAASHENERYSVGFVVLFISMTFGALPIGIDAIVPTIDLISDGLGVPLSTGQLVLTTMMIAAGFGQLIFGPLADRFGRRPALLLGAWSFLIGALLSMLAPNVAVLLLGRAFQGLGAASAMVIGRAVLRDLYEGRKLARMFSLSFAAMGLLPLIGPILGYLVAATFGWRAAFGLLFLFGLYMLLLTTFKFRETLAARQLEALMPREILRASATVLGNRQSSFFIVMQLGVSVCMFGYVISSQQIYANLNVTGIEFTIYYGVIGLGVILGQLCNQALIDRYGTVPTMVWVTLSQTTVALIGMSLGFAGAFTPLLFGSMAFFMITCFMITVANTTAMVMDPQGRIAGFASSLLGTSTFAVGAIFGTLVAFLYDGLAGRLFIGLFAVSLIMLAMITYWFWSARHQLATVD